MKRTSSYHPEHGGAGFYIILAIVLLGALTYAVSRGSRSNITSLSNDQARIAAQEIIEYGSTVANAVQKLRLRGCADTQISFENSQVLGYTNGTNVACQVFHKSGGSVNWQSPPAKANDGSDWYFTGSVWVAGFANDDFTSNDSSELVMNLADISQEVCEKINSTLSLPDNPVPDDDGDYLSTPPFTGTYVSGLGGECISGSPLCDCSGPLCNKSAGCFKESAGSERYIFYQVLIAR